MLKFRSNDALAFKTRPRLTVTNVSFETIDANVLIRIKGCVLIRHRHSASPFRILI